MIDRLKFHLVIKPALKQSILSLAKLCRKEYHIYDPENPKDERLLSLSMAITGVIDKLTKPGDKGNRQVFQAMRDILITFMSYEPYYGKYVYDLILKECKKYPIIFQELPDSDKYVPEELKNKEKG